MKFLLIAPRYKDHPRFSKSNSKTGSSNKVIPEDKPVLIPGRDRKQAAGAEQNLRSPPKFAIFYPGYCLRSWGFYLFQQLTLVQYALRSSSQAVMTGLRSPIKGYRTL